MPTAYDNKEVKVKNEIKKDPSSDISTTTPADKKADSSVSSSSAGQRVCSESSSSSSLSSSACSTSASASASTSALSSSSASSLLEVDNELQLRIFLAKKYADPNSDNGSQICSLEYNIKYPNGYITFWLERSNGNIYYYEPFLRKNFKCHLLKSPDKRFFQNLQCGPINMLLDDVIFSKDYRKAQMLSCFSLLQLTWAINKFKLAQNNYFLFAKKQLGENWAERLLAMEKKERPLAFTKQSDFIQFKNELTNLLQKIVSNTPKNRGKNSFSILGSSTSFISKSIIKNSVKTILKMAKYNYKLNGKENIHYFDKNATSLYGLSDIDIHLFIPELSDECINNDAPGNIYARPVFYDIALDTCLQRLDGLRGPSAGIINQFKNFREKWEQILGGRKISFSVRIRPKDRDQLSLTALDFKDSIELTEGINVPFEPDPGLN